MIARILCPFHEESTESCVIYDTHFKCYGCGASGPLSKIGRTERTAYPTERYREDLVNTLEYVDALPKKVIRGFDLPYDERGYYLVWPDRSYYKRRNWEDSGSKYKNPAGHAQPMFVARDVPSTRLFLVEGEFNALSVAAAFPEDSVISPGSAGNFKTERFRRSLTSVHHYCTIVLVTDRDGPGTEAAIHTKGLLLGRVKEVKIVLMSKDANACLCESGKEKLREEIEKRLSEAL